MTRAAGYSPLPRWHEYRRFRLGRRTRASQTKLSEGHTPIRCLRRRLALRAAKPHNRLSPSGARVNKIHVCQIPSTSAAARRIRSAAAWRCRRAEASQANIMPLNGYCARRWTLESIRRARHHACRLPAQQRVRIRHWRRQTPIGWRSYDETIRDRNCAACGLPRGPGAAAAAACETFVEYLKR